MAAQVQSCDYYPNFNANHTSIIKNNNQIPAFSLYQNQWDTLFIRSEMIEIPFFNNQLKIILVQDENNSFAFPTAGNLATGFIKNKGKQHTGVDFSVLKREPVVTCFDGVVRVVKKFKEYGNTVVIRHYNGLETLYALLDHVNVVTEQKVNAGDLIGYISNSTPNKKNALHFEIRLLNEFFNPEKMIDFSERKLKNNMLILTPNDFIAVPVVVSKPMVKEKGEGEQGESRGDLYGRPTEPEGEAKDPSTTSPVYHTVQKGETIYRICTKYNLSEQQLRSLNNINGDKIEIGQILRIQ